MIRQRDEAFVIDTRALGEADLIVTLFTAQHGKVRAVARAARRSRRRFGGLLEPLTRVRASWSGRDGGELHRLHDLDGVRSFAAMQAEPRRQAACAVLAEITASFAREGEADAEEFRLLAAVLEALECGADPTSVLRYFEYWTLRIHGLLPDLEREARLTAGDRRFLEAARRLSPAALAAEVPAPGPALEQLLRGLLEGFAERTFRSYRHFKALGASAGEGGGG